MQHNSFSLGCNYSYRDFTTDARTGWSSFPVQNIDTVLTNRYGVNVNVDDTFSFLYRDLYLRPLKETLKHTMLVQESVFETQIHELHRLYRRQKELMVEMEGTRHHEALYLNSSFPSLRAHWINSSASRPSTYQTESIPNRVEAVDNLEKSEKVVLDLELPLHEYNDREVERGLMNGEVHEVANFLKEQSLESSHQLNKLQLDLNEPAKIEEHSDYVFSQFLSPVTSNETHDLELSPVTVPDLEFSLLEYNDREVERGLMKVHEVANFLKEQSLESSNQLDKLQLDLNEPANSEEHSDHMFSQFLSPVTSNEIGEESDKKNEGGDSVKCKGGYEIDLNMSPLSSEEEENIVKKFETEKPQECLSVSLHEKHVSETSRVLVQALPCLNSTLLLKNPYKSSVRSSRPRKKVKLGPINKNFKGSDLDLHSSAQATSESQSNQATTGKRSSSSLSKVKSARNRTNLGKRRHCKPQMISNNGHKVVAKKKQKKSRRISLVTEGNHQEISAAEAIVDMSGKSDRETSDCITSLGRNLLWLAEISSLVVEEYESDYFEAMTLQQTEMKLEDHTTILRSNSSTNTTVSSIDLRKQRRRGAKRKCKDDQHDDYPSLGTFSEREADEDLQATEKLVEVSESKWDRGFHKCKSKRRRGPRIPAANFQHMIIN